MAGGIGSGKMRITLNMKQYEKLYFDSYSDAEIWLSNTNRLNDGVIRQEGGRYYIFVDTSQK